jgi:uncharacterized protein YbjT (DUF2867 family)
MKKVLILGANGEVARFAIQAFLKNTDAELTLYARNIERLRDVELEAPANRLHLTEGDVLDLNKLESAITGHDIVYANLDGQLEQQAKNIVTAMNKSNVKRLIFVSSMGIYNEVPGETAGAVLNPYRKSAEIIEASSLDYTIIRPAWLNNNKEVDYQTTQKGESFKNSSKYVSRASVADLIIKLATTPDRAIRGSLGVNKP